MARRAEKEYFGEKLRRYIHPLVIKALSAQRKFKLEVIGSIPENQQFIFVANHYGVDDVPTVGEVIGRHMYILASDEERKTIGGLAMDINGVVWVNRTDKAQRKRSTEAMVRHLKLGHSMLIYPEATWNLSPNLLMLPMYYGCISVSLETGVPILPIYLHFTDDTCFVEINKPFYPSEDKAASIGALRDIMTTSAWRFLEREDVLSRVELDLEMWEKNIWERFSKFGRARKNPKAIRHHEEQFVLRPKNIVTYEEAFAHLKTLNPCWENAFLFRER